MIHFILYSHENESVQQHLNNSMKHTDYWAPICKFKTIVGTQKCNLQSVKAHLHLN